MGIERTGRLIMIMFSFVWTSRTWRLTSACLSWCSTALTRKATRLPHNQAFNVCVSCFYCCQFEVYDSLFCSIWNHSLISVPCIKTFEWLIFLKYWYYTSEGKITRDHLCFGKKRAGSKNDNHIELVPCEEASLWSYEPRTGALQVYAVNASIAYYEKINQLIS